MTWKHPEANYPCECRRPEEMVEHDEVPISFDSELNEFHLNYKERGESGYYLIYFCPFCGGKMPGSLRGKQFARITDTEYSRLRKLTASIKSAEQAIDTLGKPDQDKRILSYSNLSEFANITFYEAEDGSTNLRIDRKYIGKKR